MEIDDDDDDSRNRVERSTTTAFTTAADCRIGRLTTVSLIRRSPGHCVLYLQDAFRYPSTRTLTVFERQTRLRSRGHAQGTGDRYTRQILQLLYRFMCRFGAVNDHDDDDADSVAKLGKARVERNLRQALSRHSVNNKLQMETIAPRYGLTRSKVQTRHCDDVT